MNEVFEMSELCWVQDENGMHLEHHGIKGQKWGKRRFQNEDGSYTEEGKERYGIDDDRDAKDSGKKIEDEKSKPTTGSKQEQYDATQSAVKKIFAVAAGVTLAAAAAYGAYKGAKYLSNITNRTIKSGSNVYRLHDQAGEVFNRPVYVTNKAKEVEKYRGLFGHQWKIQLGKKDMYETVGKAQSKLRIAGDRVGKKTFNKLMSEDKNFREAAINSRGITDKRKYFMADYKQFNKNLVLHDPNQQKITSKFYAKLKDMGYDGVVDVNDRDYSHYYSKGAKIIFNTDKIKQMNQTRVNEIVIDNAYKKAYRQVINKQIRDQSVKRLAVRTISLGAAITGYSGYMFGMMKVEDRMAIDQYKKDHPNTRMTDKEILKSIRG